MNSNDKNIQDFIRQELGQTKSKEQQIFFSYVERFFAVSELFDQLNCNAEYVERYCAFIPSFEHKNLSIEFARYAQNYLIANCIHELTIAKDETIKKNWFTKEWQDYCRYLQEPNLPHTNSYYDRFRESYKEIKSKFYQKDKKNTLEGAYRINND